MVATVGDSQTLHAIRGEFRYDRSDNRTMCNRPTSGVQHWQSGAEIQITCKVCQQAGPRWIVYMYRGEEFSSEFGLITAENGRKAKEALKEYVGAGTSAEASASLYPYTPEDWADAQDFKDAGCPFDYPSKLIERGARGGFRVVQC
ncbi:hypothetical protein J7I97_16910 [Streptomyces sp. ISL-87]|uniref:hypothetical protein n=1 Tax=Streptomyces sp. ISL-87 TaxID=2819188 RepID=UPI001BE9B2C3|nr:hypothetical protein [Streptomyces sp. ISL-87]MBT2609908.1 hypothetical protein [Streptomyces sp. ISL-87]